MMIRDRIVELRRMKASDLKPSPRNWRTHSTQQKDVLKGVLAEIGMADALLARELPDGSVELIDGHCRAETDSNLLWPVLILDVTEEEANKLLVTIDPLAAMAGADAAKLDGLLNGMLLENDAVTQMLKDLGKEAGCDWAKTGEVVEDEVPEPPADPITKPGDLWKLGEHRLLCGDSTDTATVDRLFAGARASLLFTSPPYGAGNVAKLRDHYVRGKKQRESFYESHEDAPKTWLSLMDGWWSSFRKSVDFLIVNVQMLADNKRDLIAWANERREELVDIVVWDKGAGAPQMQANVLSNAYEFVLMFGGNGSRAIPFANFHGTLQNIIRIDPRGKNEYADQHRAVMPIALPLWAIAELCKTAESIADPFCGTGTTLIAAEQLGRRCYGLEIEPRYCDVICERYYRLTGQLPIRESDGSPFNADRWQP